MAYVSAARGFKAGGFNLNAGPSGEFDFDPETSTTYELGTKQTWMDGLDVGAAVFYTDWKEMQLSLFDPTTGGYVDNAGESRSRGVEVEARADTFFEGLDIVGGWAFVDTEFDQGVVINGTDVSGNHLIQAPEETWNVGLQYTTQLRRGVTGFARADWIDVGTFFYDPENLASESYDLLNMQIGLRSEDVRFSIWVRNALGEDYVPIAFNLGSSADTFIGESGSPQVFGATLGFSF
jgi:iron complex outermembrane receptor protein